MLKRKFIPLFFLLGIPSFLTNFGCQREFLPKSSSMLTLDQAIEIGKTELKRVGYDYYGEKLSIRADNSNSEWQSHTKSSPSVLENRQLEKIDLKNRTFWAIYYVPKFTTPTKGGDAWVFVDRTTGEVIGVLLGE